MAFLFANFSAFAADIVDLPDVNSTVLDSIDAPENVYIAQTQVLYNLADNPVAVMYYLEPVGYIITDDHNEVIQYSLENDNTFFVDPDAHYCYTGALGYIKKEGNVYIDLRTGGTLSTDTMLIQNGLDENDLDYSSDIFWDSTYVVPPITRAVAESVSLDHATRPYNCNNSDNWDYFGFDESDGVCGSVALAITTAYMAEYHDSRFCDTSDITQGMYTQTKYGRELTKKIIEYVEPSGSGSLFLSQYNNYLTNRGIVDLYSLGSNYATKWTKAKDVIGEDDYPCILGLMNGTIGVNSGYTYGGHWVTVIGVSKNTDGSQYFHINTGYGQYSSAPLTDRIRDQANFTALYYIYN